MFRRPFSRISSLMPCVVLRKRLGPLASSILSFISLYTSISLWDKRRVRGGSGGGRKYRAVLILSVGVTATTLSTTPAIIPANIPDDFERWPFSSASAFLMESNVKKRTDALNAVPTTRVVQPVYRADTPSVRTMSRIKMMGFLVSFAAAAPVGVEDGASRSCILVLANSNGYYSRSLGSIASCPL